MKIMVKKCRFFFFILSLLSVITISLHYYLSNLAKSAVVTSSAQSKYEEIILQHLSELGPEYYKRKSKKVFFNNSFFDVVHFDGTHDLKHIWNYANSAIAKSRLYKRDNLSLIIHAMKTAKITKADYYTKGTQFKLNLTLEGDQSVVFKPRWYKLDRIFNGAVYSGRDRFQAEILSFYLSALLDKPMVPISVERTILFDEILQVATPIVHQTTVQKNSTLCLYGHCLYCVKNDPICPENGKLQGAVIFNMNDIQLKRYASPWKRVYNKNQKAKWEQDDNYCESVKKKVTKRLLHEMVDIAIFDFLLQNGDRHTYELYHQEIVWLDNGKGLGNPYTHHIDILAPLYQCCSYRPDLINRLKELSGGALTENLKKILELRQLITEEHFNALENRLLLIFATLEYCKYKTKIKH
ncbi:glycosaminoglycan xylosylkinase homolog [Atheta coriaria]|uniref:glycosaminoglycan xylosylkinase homolog n=1 Tax=Dalotia coriaria TaxID=877792 RepID=UPI0031F3DBED